MTYQELLGELKRLNIDEIRTDTTTFFEFTINTGLSDQLQNTLESYFGIAFKPAGSRPNKDAQKVTESMGGIRENQTLYLLEEDQNLNCAMIWPWSDGQTATVKLAQYERKQS